MPSRAGDAFRPSRDGHVNGDAGVFRAVEGRARNPRLRCRGPPARLPRPPIRRPSAPVPGLRGPRGTAGAPTGAAGMVNSGHLEGNQWHDVS